jgi:thiol-disulfide isomerase/thioredoxin
MKYIILLMVVVMTLLGITACDRFTRPEKLEINSLNEELVATIFNETLTTAVNEITPSDVSAVLNSYTYNYLNDGVTKSDMEARFEAIAGENAKGTLHIEYEILDSEKAKIQWVIKNTNNDIVFFDIDHLAVTDNNFLFLGNDFEATPENETVAFIEVLTATWCPNCPDLEVKVDELQEIYGNDLHFVEYHYSDGLSGDFSAIQNWYSIFSAPTGIVQGTDILIGSEENILNQYNGLIANAVGNNSNITIKNLSYTKTGNLYHFHMDLANPGQIPTDDLYLRYMFMEDTSSALNFAGKRCRNVMLEQSQISLTENDFNDVYSIEHLVSQELPVDAKIVVLIQTMPEIHNDQTSTIHAVMDRYLNK